MTKISLVLLLVALLTINWVAGQYDFDDTFIVTIKNQTVNSPFYNKGSGLKFWINDREEPTLYVERGKTYMFRYDSDLAYLHPFYLFRDVTGGLGCIRSGESENDAFIDGFFPRSEIMNANGQILYWAVPENAPDTLWYGCMVHPFMGYKILITGNGTANPLFVKKQKYFSVQDVTKIAHPWNTTADYNLDPSGIGFVINGFEGQSLFLERGVTYTFLLLNSADNPFVLPTYSSIGGVGDINTYGNLYAEGGIPKIWTYTTPLDGPDYSFYQSLKNKRVGGHIEFLDTNIIDYRVWVDRKTPDNLNYGKGDLRGYIINDIQTPKLTLERTRTYKFLVESDIMFPLRLSTLPGGWTFDLPAGSETDPNWLVTNLGWGDPGRHLENIYAYNRLPTSQNYMLLTFTPTADVPDKIYYDSGLERWMGNEIRIVDKCEYECFLPPCTDNNDVVVSLEITKDCSGNYRVQEI